MAEYLSPGVYVEEVSYRQKSIEGVSTSTTGFVGPTRFGPASGEPELLTNFTGFQEIYGGLDPMAFGNPPAEQVNYLAQAVRSFFEEGGRRLYVARTFRPHQGETLPPGHNRDGVARLQVDDAHSAPYGSVRITARYSGSGGNVLLRLTATITRNVLGGEPRDPSDLTNTPLTPTLRGVQPFDTVWISRVGSPVGSPLASGAYYWAERYFDAVQARYAWRFHPEDGSAVVPLGDLVPPRDPTNPAVGPGNVFDTVRVVKSALEVVFPGAGNRREIWSDLALHPDHPRSLSTVFARGLRSRREQLTYPIVVEPDNTLTGPQIFRILFGQPRNADDQDRIARRLGLAPGTDLSIYATLDADRLSDADRVYQLQLTGGNDGERATAAEYQPDGSDNPDLASGLRALEHIADISIIAAPGHTYDYRATPEVQANADQVTRLLISHCERLRYRVAVLDAPDGAALSEVRAFRGSLDSKYAALYYPWVTQLDPVSGVRVNLPPSGSVAGIYARNDVERGVHKSPANEVIRLAISFEQLLSGAHQDVLNPEGINCLRFFEGRGYRVWGARTISSDGEWRYLNLRRYFAYLERSIELGTQYAVFESNGDKLWRNVRQTVEDFLFNEWRNDRLFGLKPDEAFFVRCDRSTMTRSDLDGGRMVCEIGVSPLRPAEFVIFRIGQWTADSANARS